MTTSRTPRHDATPATSSPEGAVGDAMTAYLRDVRAQADRYPLLTQDEERTLVVRIHAGMFAPGSGIYGPPTPDAHAAYERFVGANLRLVIPHAARQARIAHTLGVVDLIQAGNIGLLVALWKFDPHRGHKFSTYATPWIRQHIQRERELHDRMIALPVHVQDRTHRQARTDAEGRVVLPADARSYDRPADLLQRDGENADLRALLMAPGDVAESVAARVDAAALGAGLRLVLDGILTARERAIMGARWGLDGEEPRTLSEAGAVFGVTRERVRQIEARALTRLRQVLRVAEDGGGVGIDEATFMRLVRQRQRAESAEAVREQQRAALAKARAVNNAKRAQAKAAKAKAAQTASTRKRGAA